MRPGAPVVFLLALVGIIALINFQTSTPSAQTVQPTGQVHGYCPVENAGQNCFIRDRPGVCICQTLDSNLPLYWQRDNCECFIPSRA